MFVLAITAAIFLAAGGVLAYVLIRYRQRATDPDHEPPQIYGSNQIELSWTVIPMLIVVVLFLTTAASSSTPNTPASRCSAGCRGYRPSVLVGISVSEARHRHCERTSYPGQRSAPPDTYLLGNVFGRHGPQLLGSPISRQDGCDSQPRQCDVDRSGVARSLPGTVRAILRDAARQNAAARVWAVSSRLRHVGRAAAAAGETDPSTADGQAVFLRNACINCHTIAGTTATGRFGPDLTHLASRDTIASGAIQNTPENLRKWIDNPDQMKPGCLMPAMHLNDHDLNAVTAYLTTLH